MGAQKTSIFIQKLRQKLHFLANRVGYHFPAVSGCLWAISGWIFFRISMGAQKLPIFIQKLRRKLNFLINRVVYHFPAVRACFWLVLVLVTLRGVFKWNFTVSIIFCYTATPGELYK